MRLFRPVGLRELQLVYEADMQAFPPRLPEQPIFYPVLNEDYAIEIAREWNTKSDARAGFVTRFEVDDEYARQFERKVVGSREHEELWGPAEELRTFNEHIQGAVEVVAAFFGDDYEGFVPEAFGLRGKTAHQQFVALAQTLPYSTFDVAERDEIIERLEAMWAGSSRSAVPLGVVR